MGALKGGGMVLKRGPNDPPPVQANFPHVPRQPFAYCGARSQEWGLTSLLLVPTTLPSGCLHALLLQEKESVLESMA